MQDASKIVLMSDNHFQKKEVQAIVAMHKADTDFFVHCGDSQWNVDDPFFKNVLVVKGNNDFQKFPPYIVFETYGHRILVTHGHMQYVVWDGKHPNIRGTDELVDFAKSHDATIAFYGHTHVPEQHEDRGVYVVNPGSTNYPRNYQNRMKTYAVVTVSEHEIVTKFFDAITHEDVTSRI